MKIYNQTMYDKDLIIEYNNYYFLSFLKTKFSLMSLMVIGFSVYLLLIQRLKYAILLFCILILYLLLVYFIQQLTTKRSLKKNPIVENPIMQEYLFLDDGIVISSNKQIKYEELYKVNCSKKFILLFSKEKRTYIVKKTGFHTLEEASRVETYLKGIINTNKQNNRRKAG